MKPDMQQFRMRRADNLAFLHLTDRADITVDRLPSREPGTDFRVTLLENGVPTEKSFCVLFKGIPGSVEHPGDLNRLVKRDGRGVSAADQSLPLCLFAFTMADDRGYYAWLDEPDASARNGLRKRKAGDLCWRVLDENGMAEIVAAVNAWYDAQRRAQAA
ncbi:MAG TPA: hypothetical protein VF705_04435 [Longimicrobium sp.]